MDLVGRIYKKALVALLLLAVASALIEPRRLPAGIIAGGLLGLINLRGLAWGVEGLFRPSGAKGRMIFFSLFRLFMLFSALSVLVYLRVVNIFGILTGLTCVFTLLIVEGLRYAKSLQEEERDA